MVRPIKLILGLLISISTSNIFADQVNLSAEEESYLSNKNAIYMCVGPDFMPYEDIVEGQYVGMIAEYMDLLSQKLQIPFELVPTKNWDETMQKARAHDCDIVTFIIPTDTRRQFLNFTKPYMREPFVISTTNDKPYVAKITSILDKPLGVVKGYAYIEIYRKKYPNINIVEVDDVVQGLEMLDAGELYGYLDGLNVVGYHIQKEGLSDLKINGTLREEWKVSIGSRKDQPLLNQILNKAIDSISVVEKQRVKNSWMSVTYEHEFDYTLIIQVSAVALFILAFVIYRQSILRKHNKLLETLSETDRLTGINNRMKLDKCLMYELEKFARYHNAFSIILLDIDHFKQFNDSFGHLIGDMVLQFVANSIKENCRSADMVGRWGGEEFLIICPNTNLQSAYQLAEKLRKTIKDKDFNQVENVTVSSGIAEVSARDNFNTIVARADKAMYQAKEAGRNCTMPRVDDSILADNTSPEANDKENDKEKNKKS